MNNGRNVKYRVWYPGEKRFYYLTIEDTFAVLGKDAWAEPYTIQLSTGCHDKNKTEIFEGDKVKYRDRVGTVEFFAGKFQLDWGDQTDGDLAYLMIDDMEVVGNIFEGIVKLMDVVDAEEEDDLDLDNCEQCDEKAWDGYICHACGAKNI